MLANNTRHLHNPSTSEAAWHSSERAGILAGGAHLVPLAIRGLSHMWRGEHSEYAQTVRLLPSLQGPWLRPEGRNRRYSAIVALGCGRLAENDQREVLRGQTAAQFTEGLAHRTDRTTEAGAVALTAWAAAEILGTIPEPLVDLLDAVVQAESVETVALAWALTATASTAASEAGALSRVRETSRSRLVESLGRGGVFPHRVPARSQNRVRAHVGSFADQIYPVQALTRLASGWDDSEAQEIASRCADVLVRHQGAQGQWWWHYDTGRGAVVEKYPVYSVHQHGMAPMVLGELERVLPGRYADSISLGLSWLKTHPETPSELVDDRNAMIWRKVGRREPAKLVRKVASVVTSAGGHLPSSALNRAFPAQVVDLECRPYELGWLLYAWAGTTGSALPNGWALAAR